MKLYSLRTLHIDAKSKSDLTDNLDFCLTYLVSWKTRRKYWENFLLCFVKGEEHGAECTFLFVRGHLKFSQDRQKSWLNLGFKQDRRTDGRTDRQTDGIKILWAWKFIFCIVSAWNRWRETRTRTSFINSIIHKKFRKS